MPLGSLSRIGGAPPAKPPIASAARRITYISWAESCSRSDHTARELGGTSHMIYAGAFGSHPVTVALKYAVQAWRTMRILRSETPDTVFVMSPPVFAALPAFIHTWQRGGRVVLDAHTAAFLHPRWRLLQWLQRALCRRAATTIVHNRHLADLVTDGGAHATVVPDVPVVFGTTERFERPAEFTVAAVCSFNYDEPVDEMMTAAAQLPDVRFFVTGNPRHLQPRLKATLPANVTLTGFLSIGAYGGLLQSADAVLTLTTRDHTMLRGAYEAIYQGTPVIVSDWPLLRQAFELGAVHVDNTAAGIVRGIRRMRSESAGYRAGALALRDRKLQMWAATRQAILDRIS